MKYQIINVDSFFNVKYSDVDAKATGVKNVHSFQITLAMVQIRVVVDMEGKPSMSCSSALLYSQNQSHNEHM